MKRILLSLVILLLLVGSALAQVDKPVDPPSAGELVSSAVMSLDGDGWLLATASWQTSGMNTESTCSFTGQAVTLYLAHCQGK